MVNSLDEVIERLQYKADNIKAKLEPSYFTECIDYLKGLKRGEFEQYEEGQLIEPSRPRVYTTIEEQAELKAYRDFGDLSQLRVLCDRYHELVEQNNELIRNEQEIRNKAIDELVSVAMERFTSLDLSDILGTVTSCKIILRDIAEQMKGE